MERATTSGFDGRRALLVLAEAASKLSKGSWREALGVEKYEQGIVGSGGIPSLVGGRAHCPVSPVEFDVEVDESCQFSFNDVEMAAGLTEPCCDHR